MKVRVEIVGTGADSDPYRADLPMYFSSDFDYKNKRVIVDIPDRDVPASMLAMTADTTTMDPIHGPVKTKVNQKELADWYQHLDGIYVERAGKHRPKVV